MFKRLVTIILIVIFSVWFGDFLRNAKFSAVQFPSIQKVVMADSVNKEGYYSVVKVVDGDTIEVNVDGVTEKIRLIGVDTPETVDPRKPVQCFGKEASDHTKSILNGKPVKLEADSTQDDRDKYQRLLRYVILEDGSNYNLQLIKDGYAYEYTYDVPYKYQKEFKAAQKDAQDSGRGLWAADTCDGRK